MEYFVVGEKLEPSEVEEIIKDCAEPPDDEGLTTYAGKFYVQTIFIFENKYNMLIKNGFLLP